MSTSYNELLDSIKTTIDRKNSAKRFMLAFIAALKADLVRLADAPEDACRTGTMAGRLSFERDRYDFHGGSVVFGIELRFPVESRYVTFPVPVALREQDGVLVVNVKGRSVVVVGHAQGLSDEDVRVVALSVLDEIRKEVAQRP